MFEKPLKDGEVCLARLALLFSKDLRLRFCARPGLSSAGDDGKLLDNLDPIVQKHQPLFMVHAYACSQFTLSLSISDMNVNVHMCM